MTNPVDDPRPQPPEKPDPLDCCGGGCVCCIYDAYGNACDKYQAELAAWQARHPGQAGS